MADTENWVNCRFCSNILDGRAIKCHYCGEFLKFDTSSFASSLPLISIIVSLFSIWVAFSSYNISSRQFRLTYATQLEITPVILETSLAQEEVIDGDPNQIWVDISVNVTNKGTVDADNVRIKYGIGGPCRGYFTDDLRLFDVGFVEKKPTPFDVPAGETIPISIRFTDARHCVTNYLTNRDFIGINFEATFHGISQGKEKQDIPYSSSWKSVGGQFRRVYGEERYSPRAGVKIKPPRNKR